MSNHLKRVLIAIVGIPVIIAASVAGGIYFFLLVSAISALSLYEFYKIAEKKGAKPVVTIGIVSGFFVNLSFFHVKLRDFIAGYAQSHAIFMPFPSQTQLLFMTILIVVILLGLVELFRNNGSAILNLSATVLGIIYISLFFGTLIGLREVFVPFDFPINRYFSVPDSYADPAVAAQVYRWGGYTVISILAMIWVCDSAAYYAGTAFGKHKLFPRVSPKKSWEGSIAGFIFAIITAVAAKYIALDYLPLGSAVIIGVIAGVFGQLGDLLESLLKRDAGVKDSSLMIPGHGGVFDRFDSLLLVSPLVYLYIDYILLS